MPTDQELIRIVPSDRQLAYQETEFYAFFHFGMNTYTDREWGDGTEDPKLFNPAKLDADQWVSAAKSAGMKGVILTCKHHDGFCLWPTRYTSHSVACGEGPNGKQQVYDWERYYACVRKYQPDACICVCGPDIRWCGNEAGDVRKSEWSVVPARTALAESIQEKSQQADDEEFRQRKITSDMEDLGSRAALQGEKDLIWYPAEVNTSIRPGWFYHTKEDNQVKSLEELISIYCGSVGGNATFLLNVPPMPNGLLHPNDVARLAELGQWKRSAFSGNLAEFAEITASSEDAAHPVQNVLTDTRTTWYQPETDAKTGAFPAELIFNLHTQKALGYLVIKEAIQHSQRVEAFCVYAQKEEKWVLVYEGTVIGYQKIVKLSEAFTRKLKIVFSDYRVAPLISFVGIYPKR